VVCVRKFPLKPSFPNTGYSSAAAHLPAAVMATFREPPGRKLTHIYGGIRTSNKMKTPRYYAHRVGGISRRQSGDPRDIYSVLAFHRYLLVKKALTNTLLNGLITKTSSVAGEPTDEEPNSRSLSKLC
jgi:hypothetical protein